MQMTMMMIMMIVMANRLQHFQSGPVLKLISDPKILRQLQQSACSSIPKKTHGMCMQRIRISQMFKYWVLGWYADDDDDDDDDDT